ncbi:MAG TPA: SDR family oxidoreductase [Burkholderiales bacterium]|nr:SDR family oxidoreductase [Burkholderiales bacterium]
MSRVIVITGASEGIGALLARRLGAKGDSLVLGARRLDRLEQVAKETGSSALAVPTDVTKRAEIDRLRDAALQRFGHIDVWVNNAGRGIGLRVMEFTEENLDEMLAVNLKSAWYGMQAVIPHFQARRRGHLVNISSVLARVPLVSARSAYSAAKAALNALTANLRMDLRAEYPDIHVSLVMPGPVATEFHNNALGGTPAGRGIEMQSTEQVVEVLEQVIDRPVSEAYTNPSATGLVRNYYQDVAAFEEGLAARTT